MAISAGAPPAQAASMTSRDSLRERASATGAQTINANTPANPGTNHSAISTMQYARKAITTAGIMRSADSRERNSPTQSEAHPRATARTHDDTTRSAALSKTKATGSRMPPIRNRTNADVFAAFARRRPGEKDAHRPNGNQENGVREHGYISRVRENTVEQGEDRRVHGRRRKQQKGEGKRRTHEYGLFFRIKTDRSVAPRKPTRVFFAFGPCRPLARDP